MIVVAEPFRRGDERGDDLAVRGCGVVLTDVLVARPLLADRAGRDHEVADVHSRLDRAAGADTNERLDADAREFLDGDGRRGRPDPGGGHRYRGVVVGPRCGAILAVVCDLLVSVPQRGHFVDTLGIPRQEDGVGDVVRTDLEVVLFLRVRVLAVSGHDRDVSGPPT